MVNLTQDEWRTIRDAIITLKVDVDEAPNEYVEGADSHLRTLMMKLPVPYIESKVYLV